ncbi:uncharacterized protein LOC129577379 isoform X2 [Sitodiplosis mosellana]|uniref:uncharacterized protein LOC129577379 isoform X2 n=1 Tax=Sitodiplosis mosellana TaxID=263140 RepID=UPI00244453D3|nr:uncharacterized protein LOC129577379 isoform X2 [Sitodiplosis mosellana]
MEQSTFYLSCFITFDGRPTTAAHQLHGKLRTRLENYPTSPQYQTQVNYPGSSNAAQHQAKVQYMQMVQLMQQQPNWVQRQVQPNYVQSAYVQTQPQQQPNYVQTQQQPAHIQTQQQQPAYVQTQQQQPNYVQNQQQPAYVQTQHQPAHVHSQKQPKKHIKSQPAANVNTRINYQGPEYEQVQTFQTAPTAPVVPVTTTTTTPQPIFVNEQVEEEEAEEVPAPIPVPAVRAPVRRIRPQPVQQVQPVKLVQHRFQPQSQGQDFDDDLLAQQEISRIPHEETEEERLLREKQAKNAYYSFGTSIDDKINDHSIQRSETREGLALRGMYSYSDGYFKRTIHYEADENGYRVVKEEIEPIGDGPQYNPNGTADVTADLHNNQLSYSITADDFVREKDKKKPKTARQYDEDEE